MSYVDDFIKAENELRARQEAAVQRQRKQDREASMHMTGKMLLRFFGGVLLGALFVAACLAWFWSGR